MSWETKRTETPCGWEEEEIWIDDEEEAPIEVTEEFQKVKKEEGAEVL